MNLKTFGSSPAAGVLVKILNDRKNHKLNRKVSACLHDFYIGLREIRKTSIGFTLREMWKNKMVNRVKNGFDPEIANFMRNVMITECRKEA